MKKGIAVILVAMAFTHAGAIAAPKSTKGAPQVRYFDLSSSLFTELGAEAILKETRQGNAVVAAELDVCHYTDANSSQLDRFVVPLKVEGTRLLGTGQTQEQKLPVSVNLLRRSLANGTFTFEGTVRSGPHSDKIRSTDNNELSEDEIMDQYLGETTIADAGSDFLTVWPQSLLVRVGRDGLIALLDALRDQNVRIGYDGMVTTCSVLRAGTFTVQIDVDPERAGAVLEKVKTVSVVKAAGFSGTTPNMQRAIRFPSSGWRDAAGTLDRDKLATAVAGAMGEAMAATVSSTSWDPVLGELKVEMKRPNDAVPGIKLAQLVTITANVAPESLASREHSILWINSVTGRIVEERDTGRLEFFTAEPDEGDENQSSEPDGTENLPEAVAIALKGVTWDSEQEQWQQ